MRRAPTRPQDQKASEGFGTTDGVRSILRDDAQELASTKMSTGFQRPVEGDLDPGDELGVTLGAETFRPVKYNAFSVGPISVRVRVRQGEKAADAYARARRMAEVAFEAEFELKRQGFAKRHAEVGR